MAEMQYQSDGPHRPSFRFKHDCGNDMGRMRLANGAWLYVCGECEVRISDNLAMPGEINRYRVEKK